MQLEEITEIYETEYDKEINKKLGEGFRIIKIHCGEKDEMTGSGSYRKIPYTKYILGKIK